MYVTLAHFEWNNESESGKKREFLKRPYRGMEAKLTKTGSAPGGDNGDIDNQGFGSSRFQGRFRCFRSQNPGDNGDDYDYNVCNGADWRGTNTEMAGATRARLIKRQQRYI